jgi:hypothetical protein
MPKLQISGAMRGRNNQLIVIIENSPPTLKPPISLKTIWGGLWMYTLGKATHEPDSIEEIKVDMKCWFPFVGTVYRFRAPEDKVDASALPDPRGKYSRPETKG